MLATFLEDGGDGFAVPLLFGRHVGVDSVDGRLGVVPATFGLTDGTFVEEPEADDGEGESPGENSRDL